VISYKSFSPDPRSSSFLQSVVLDVRNFVSRPAGSSPEAVYTPNPRFASATDFLALAQAFAVVPRNAATLKGKLGLLAQASASKCFPFQPSFASSGLCELLIEHLPFPKFQQPILRALVNFSWTDDAGFICALYGAKLFPALAAVLQRQPDPLALTNVVQLLANCALYSREWRDAVID
jgi:hypothetical protein